MDLPITQWKGDLIDAIREHTFLLVVGETGSGKTTQLPQYIHSEMPEYKRIAISQPRRVAAMSVADRVSHELGVKIGGKEVGYRIRFDDCTSNDTKLIFMTDG